MYDSQSVFKYLGHELTVRSANDLICARALYVVDYLCHPINVRFNVFIKELNKLV